MTDDDLEQIILPLESGSEWRFELEGDENIALRVSETRGTRRGKRRWHGRQRVQRGQAQTIICTMERPTMGLATVCPLTTRARLLTRSLHPASQRCVHRIGANVHWQVMAPAYATLYFCCCLPQPVLFSSSQILSRRLTHSRCPTNHLQVHSTDPVYLNGEELPPTTWYPIHRYTKGAIYSPTEGKLERELG